MENRAEHLIYASAEEVKARLNKQKFSRNEQILNQCDGMMVEEFHGELKAVIDIEVYQHLVKLLIETIENEKK